MDGQDFADIEAYGVEWWLADMPGLPPPRHIPTLPPYGIQTRKVTYPIDLKHPETHRSAPNLSCGCRDSPTDKQGHRNFTGRYGFPGTFLRPPRLVYLRRAGEIPGRS
jgi:hypothetical protein